MVQHFLDATTIKTLQAGAKCIAHLLGTRALLTGLYVIVLVDVIVLQFFQTVHRIVQTCSRHAPRTDRRADQIYGLIALRQPFPKNKSV
jgi:hypothetical protein